MTSDQLPTQRPTTAPANLADVLERILDKGLVVAGDIRIDLMGIELLTIKIRLLLVSADKAEELGMAWWRNDPYFTGEEAEIERENQRLRERLARLEALVGEHENGGEARDEAGSNGGQGGAQQLTQLGGGWWQLPSGERVQGRERAEAALRERA